jgi:hypothetical protein
MFDLRQNLRSVYKLDLNSTVSEFTKIISILDLGHAYKQQEIDILKTGLKG